MIHYSAGQLGSWPDSTGRQAQRAAVATDHSLRAVDARTWTRPAERAPGTLRQSMGDRWKPNR